MFYNDEIHHVSGCSGNSLSSGFYIHHTDEMIWSYKHSNMYVG